MEDERVEGKNVTMYPWHWSVVERHRRAMRDDSLSKALRRIVEDWESAEAQGSSLKESSPQYSVVSSPCE